MMRHARMPLLVIAGWSIPSPAHAAGSASAEPVAWGIGVLTLAAAVVLLVIALGLARVADGSAMAENISYVVVACICLAGSVLAAWAARFVTEAAVADQIAIGGQGLVIVAIVCFCVYFFRVRLALRRFLSALSGEDVLARAHMADGADVTSAGPEGGAGDSIDG